MMTDQKVPKVPKVPKVSKVTKQFLVGPKEGENLKLQLARALADYDNLAKRTQIENENITRVAQARSILRILPIFDMLINAQGHLKDQGLELVIQEFKAALGDLGVEQIVAVVGAQFDPELHEAIDVREGEEGKIMEVARNGYIIDGRVLRHAQVIVGQSTNNDPELVEGLEGLI